MTHGEMSLLCLQISACCNAMSLSTSLEVGFLALVPRKGDSKLHLLLALQPQGSCSVVCWRLEKRWKRTSGNEASSKSSGVSLGVG